MAQSETTGFWFTNLPIQWKLGSVIALLIGLLLAVLVFNSLAVHTATSVQQETERLAKIVNQSNVTARAISRRQITLVRLIFDNNDRTKAAFDEADSDTSAQFAKLEQIAGEDRLFRRSVEQASGLNKKWAIAVAQPLLTLAQQQRGQPIAASTRDAAVGSFLDAETRDGGSRDIVNALDGVIRDASQQMEQVRDSLQVDDTDLFYLDAITVVLTVLGGIGAFFMANFLIARPLRQLAKLMTQLAEHDHSIVIPFRHRRDEVGTISRALGVFKDMSVATSENDWVKSGIAELSARVQQAGALRAFADTLLQDLVPRLKAGVGVFFAFDETRQDLQLIGSYGYRERRHLSTSYGLGEGLVGQCAVERKPIVLSPVPDDYVRIHSGTGEASPSAVLVVPILAKDRLLGVLELASFEPFHGVRQRLVEESSVVIGLSLDNLTRALKTSELLEQSQRQSQELQVAEEELRVQQEELRTTNEKLQEQSQRLIASEEELRVQAQELQKSNEDLRRHSEAVTEQKSQLEALQQETEARAADLARANQYKSQFLANMSHELRTPLNSMLILSQDLAENRTGNLDEEQVEAAAIVHSSGSNLLRLINEILDLSKVEAGKMEVIRESIALAAFCQRMERNFRHVAQEKGLDFTVERKEETPEAILTDEGKLEQITNNLLGNAFKFTKSGFVKVVFSPSLDGKRLLVAVSDSGIGIPAAKLDLVFEAFEQVDSSTRRQYGGTGLGLAISKSLAVLLGGTLAVESEEGKGSTFVLELPLSEVPAGVVPAARPPLPEPAPAMRLPRVVVSIEDDREHLEEGKPRILIVEDDPVFARTLVGIVRRSGYQALAAGDGESGLALARTLKPTGILLDIMLPGMDGWSVIEQLKLDRATQHIPVHIVSALEEASRGRQMGAVGFLTKPVSAVQLTDALTALAHFAPGRRRRVLVVDDDAGARHSVQKLLAKQDVDVTCAATGEEAVELIGNSQFDCMVLDLGLPGMSGFDVLEHLAEKSLHLPVVVYSGREVTAEESMRLRGYTDSIVIKGVLSPERLLDEVSLFLHSVRNDPASVPDYPDSDMAGRHVLVVDDDMRNIFALAKVLRGKGLTVILAQDGAKALDQLDAHPEIEMVLMDIMMPVMDGYEAMTQIRKRGGAFAKLPIIALTAKAMKDDREKCLMAGANDYMSKPIDVPRLLSMMRAWMPPK